MLSLLTLDAAPSSSTEPSRKGHTAWLGEQRLGSPYWTFFTAAFFFDAGFGIYFFLFNLFLLDLGYNERAIGLVGGALTIGSMLGTLPGGELTRRFGVRPLLIVCFIAAPALGIARTLWVWQPAQIGLAFITGLVMSAWGVCFLPALARLTDERNRAAGFSLIFSVSIGTSALGGVLCSALPGLAARAGFGTSPANLKRVILLGSCVMAFAGLAAVLRLRMPAPPDAHKAIEAGAAVAPMRHGWRLAPFLLRYLPCMALWSAVLAAFTPFGNIFLTRDLNLPLERVALVFSLVQVVQFVAGLATPLLLRIAGVRNGIACMQGAAAVLLAALAIGHHARLGVVLYLVFSAAQWMSSPALYKLLMDHTPDNERSPAAAMVMFANALAGAGATMLTGSMLTRFGYPPVLLGIAAFALFVTMLFRFVVQPASSGDPASLDSAMPLHH